MLDRSSPLHAGSRFTGRRSIVAASVALLFALPGASSAQQVQWVQSPINGHWYGAEYTPRTWPNSEALAVSLGGHLATVRNQAEQDWIQASFAPLSGSNDDFWIGYTDAVSEGAWSWTSGDSATYTNWANLEPNGGTNENFVHLITWAGGLWNDNSPSHTFRCLLEVPVLPPRSWSWSSVLGTGSHPLYGCTADIDGDGDLDYASPSLDADHVAIYTNDGHGVFTLTQVVSGCGHPVTLLPFDPNGDNHPDLALTDFDGRLLQLMNNGTGAFAAPTTVASAVPIAHGLQVGDLNSDGLDDLVVTSAGADSKVRVFLGQSNGSFVLGQTINALFSEDFFSTVVDLDGDGNPDLVVTGTGACVLRGSTTGALTFVGNLGSGDAGKACATDVDGDGDQDLLIPRGLAGTLEVWTNDGAGNLQATQSAQTTGANPFWSEASDLDGDGDFDALIPNRGSGTITVMLNDGSGHFSAAETLLAPGDPVMALARDVNADGRSDVLFSAQVSSAFGVVLNQSVFDCNLNGVIDYLDILNGTSIDCNGNGRPDECDIAAGQPDCDGNGALDSCEIATTPSFDLDLNGILDRCQPAGTPYCFGDGSGGACPCDPGQAGSPGHGCANSSGEGAVLSATGSISVTGDSLQLHVANMPNPSSVLFFQGTVQQNGGMGAFNGDGLLCANGPGGNLIRLGVHAGQPGSSSFGAGVGSDPLISVRGQIPTTGGTRYYQAWYRDNTAFCTASLFNFSNGLGIVWAP